MEDATRILDAGTQDYPLDASASASAESCPHCSTMIQPGSMFCSSCGYQRNTWAAAKAQATASASPAVDRGPALYELRDIHGNTYALPAGESVLGRGEVDISIADGYLSRQHARFTATHESLSIMDLGSANGSFVADLKLIKEAPHELQDGQEFILGKLSFVVRELAAQAPDERLISSVEAAYSDVAVDEVAGEASSENIEIEAAESLREASSWCLEHGAHGTLSIPLGELTLGRSASKSDIPISGDGFISGLHGKLLATEDGLAYTDLGSTNGSMLNGVALEANVETRLTVGDKLQLGQTEFEVSLASTEIEGNSDEPKVMA
jgi:pSer/pThr/pTyr-binding forkhead associated (FHA) protein